LYRLGSFAISQEIILVVKVLLAWTRDPLMRMDLFPTTTKFHHCFREVY
jgi:hypothetical protein